MALAIDGSHRLLFSDFAARDAGRAHGAFWDAMLGWLMRDPRFEPAVVDVKGGCIAGEDATLVLRPLAGQKGEAIAQGGPPRQRRRPCASATPRLDGSGKPVELAAGALDAGGYSAVVEIGAGAGKGPTTRRDFACEKGGDEWADSRPDVARLEAIAAATGGKYVRRATPARCRCPPRRRSPPSARWRRSCPRGRGPSARPCCSARTGWCGGWAGWCERMHHAREGVGPRAHDPGSAAGDHHQPPQPQPG